ncbi:MAG: LuxR C-terminal-related transcriptional regulator [Pseudomonadota bacterium]
MQDPDLIPIASRILATSGMGSVGLYPFDKTGRFEPGVIVGMPDAFIRAYEITGVPIDPILAEMRRTRRPVSTRSVLGSRWTDCQLYRRVSGRFGLTGFATLPLYCGAEVSGVLYLGANDERQAARLEGADLCDLTIHASQASSELVTRPRRHAQLTRRQDQVARLAADGLTNRQIAEELRTGEAAVAKHMKALRALFGTSTRTAMARRYLETL